MNWLCDHCSWPAPCPCTLNQTTRLEVARRHRAAVQLAKRHGWPGNTQRPPRIVTDPTGRSWVA